MRLLCAFFLLVVISARAADKATVVLDKGSVGSTVKVPLLPGGQPVTFCYCPEGSFTMGSPQGEQARSANEGPVNVVISKGFWLAQTECTQALWESVMGKNPSKFTDDKDLPVERVSWVDVQAFLTKVNSTIPLPVGWKLTLPTEAQWEYACRAGTTTVFSFGDSMNSTQANFDGGTPYGNEDKGPYLEKTCKVGSYAANAWGLHDMHGNVLEWCLDWYADQLPGGTDPVGAAEGTTRVFRGGCWVDVARRCRAGNRSKEVPTDRYYGLGFRLAAVRD